MRRSRLLILVLTLGLGLLGAACSSSSDSRNDGTPTSPPPTPTAVTVTPGSVSLSPGANQMFTASVSGVTDQTVSWSVNGVRGGSDAFGLISADGVYVAPTAIPAGSTVTVRAAAFSGANVSGAASVTIRAASGVVVDVEGNGARIIVPTFGSRAFSAQVTGSGDTAVTWQVNGIAGGSAAAGTITPEGFYTAPHSAPVSGLPNNEGQATEVVVTAVSRADPTVSDSAIVVPEPPQRHAYAVPVPLGTSGGNAEDTSVSGQQSFCCGGTLGALLVRNGIPYILSNNHVIARSDLGSPGEAIVQPSLTENGCSTSGISLVGTLTEFFDLENGPAPRVDAAIAAAAGNAVDPVGTIIQLGGGTAGGMPTDGSPNPGGGIAPELGQGVAKSGSATGITCGTIIAVDATVRIEYRKGCGTGTTFNVTYTNQIDIAGAGFSAAGDSGSLVVTRDTADPVGLLYGGSVTDTVANPVSDVLQQLADPVTSMPPMFAGDVSVGAHPVAACTQLLQEFEPALDFRAGVAGVSATARRAAGAAIDAHALELLAYPGVQALGAGASLDEPGDPAILIFVRSGAGLRPWPVEVDGIRTRIVEGGDFAQSGRLTDSETEALERAAAPPRIVSPLSEAEVTRARPVVAERAAGLMARRGIQGVGVTSSLDAPGEVALMIFVVRGEARDPVPTVIDGVRMRLRETSRFRAR